MSDAEDGTAQVAITTETIKLGQFVKLANVVATGGEAKQAIAEGAFTVNGVVEKRRGRILSNGDIVGVVNEPEFRVRVTALSSEGGA